MDAKSSNQQHSRTADHPRKSMNKWLAVPATTLVVVIASACSRPALVDAECYDRRTQPFTSVVDSHVHLRPFGGPAIPLQEMAIYWSKTTVRYVNLYGIGQTVPADSPCTDFVDCPGTPVLPSMKNDLENARDVRDNQVNGVSLTLSMTFPDLANPAGTVDGMRALDARYPGGFGWMGEVNVVKQALLGNAAEPASLDDIQAWRPFMDELRRRDIPITLHSDLGNDAEPLEYLSLMQAVLTLYPDNKIVWAHAGLSVELANIEPALHIATLRRLMDQHANLYLDLSWRVLQDEYFSKEPIRDQYVPFLNRYSSRILTGTDFVASRRFDFSEYAADLEATSQINKYLDDNAFRDIALGQSYFDLLRLPRRAPLVCTS
jgi:predicted TIM-barrel fold metal-dependent hydrolase